MSPASARRLRRRTGFARTIRPTFGREGHRERASDRASDRRGATRVREGHRERLTDAGPASSAKVIASDPQTRGHPRPRRSSRERARGRRRCDRPRTTFVGDGHRDQATDRDRATDAGPPSSAKVVPSGGRALRSGSSLANLGNLRIHRCDDCYPCCPSNDSSDWTGVPTGGGLPASESSLGSRA